MTYRRVCMDAIVYVKPNLKEEEDYVEYEDDSFVYVVLNEDLLITFLVNDSESEFFTYIQNRHLKLEGVDKDALLKTGINNLYSLAENSDLQIQELDEGCFMLTLDGSFEASLILLDTLWDHTLTQYAPDGFAVAIPARDVLVFCNINSKMGIEKLKNVISNVWEDGDHLLIDKVLKRNDGKWSNL